MKRYKRLNEESWSVPEKQLFNLIAPITVYFLADDSINCIKEFKKLLTYRNKIAISVFDKFLNESHYEKLLKCKNMNEVYKIVNYDSREDLMSQFSDWCNDTYNELFSEIASDYGWDVSRGQYGEMEYRKNDDYMSGDGSNESPFFLSYNDLIKRLQQ